MLIAFRMISYSIAGNNLCQASLTLIVKTQNSNDLNVLHKMNEIEIKIAQNKKKKRKKKNLPLNKIADKSVAFNCPYEFCMLDGIFASISILFILIFDKNTIK